MKLEYYREIFVKYSSIKYHEYPYSGSQVAPCEQTEEQI